MVRKPNKKTHRIPVLDHIKHLEYRRPPAKGEINFGHGVTHYRTFTIQEACYPNTRIAKRWFVAADDGLRYYR